MVRNPIGLRERLGRMRGTPIEFDLSAYDEPLARIRAVAAELEALPDEAFGARARMLRHVPAGGAPADRIVETFALVCEASRRTIGLSPYPVQVVAALALHAGHVAEMQTGEGKTLAAVMPATVNALTGRGVHVLTFNDYLARRDAEWMGPIYRLLGVSLGCVQSDMTGAERQAAYRADVTYLTAKEAGFDYLRDRLATDARALVQRPFHMAIVDEADSLLVDEARVPLVIAGRAGDRPSSASGMDAIAAGLKAGEHFTIDEYGRNVELTERGVSEAERLIGRGSLHREENLTLLTELNCALHARTLLKRDVDYLVRDGRIALVDEFTGRVVADRHWPDGLQGALEAKERVSRQGDGHILGTMTLQHLLQAYPRLCGMTGTAQAAAEELFEFYGLRTVVVPTNRRSIRVDHPDVVFTHRAAKEAAVVQEVRRAHATGRPVLVGTLTIEESERMAGQLAAAGVCCDVLNAKNDSDEAAIVARAGARGAVTISTNMAGRGTDIRLGRPALESHDPGSHDGRRDVSHAAHEGGHDGGRDVSRAVIAGSHADIASLGGLYVIGTNRHESRRVDQQLRGRAGRQGDPGDTRFFVSLEDDLMLRFRLRDLIPSRFWPEPQADPIDVPVITREIARAQRIIEGQDREIRRTLWRYARPIEEQRRRVQQRRQAILLGDVQPDVWQRDSDRHAHLASIAGEDAVCEAERTVTLWIMDRAWRDHLAYVADLREGVHLVRLGGGDPLSRFGLLSAEAFHKIEDDLEAAILAALSTVEAHEGRVDLSRLDIKGPSSTWTYLVDDDPFRRQLGMQLAGPGGVTFAIGSAILVMPLFILMGLVDRYLPARRRRLKKSAAERQSGPR